LHFAKLNEIQTSKISRVSYSYDKYCFYRLLNLVKSKIDESYILNFIESLAFSRGNEETMFRLRLALEPILLFEHLVVAIAEQSDIQTSNFLTSICATDSDFNDTYWPICKRFTEAFNQEVIIADNLYEDLEFEIQPLPVKQKMTKAVLFSFSFSERKGMFIFTIAKNQKVGDLQINQLKKLSPILKQAYVQFEQDYWIKKRVNERTLALKMSEQRFKGFAKTASDWFWETDKDFRYTYLSNSDDELKYVKYKGFVGSTPLELRSENEACQLKKWSHFLHLVNQKKEIFDFEFEVIGTNGIPYWMSLSGYANFDNNNQYVGYMGTAKDITYSKQREIDLQHAKQNAERASAAKTQFLAVMSHEIRTPMNAILGMLELMQDTGLTNEQQELHDYINSSAKLLQGVISDTLDFSKIENGKLELEYSTVNLHILVKNITKQFETQAVKRGLTFNVYIDENVPKLILSDATRLAQIFFNILGNAFKFTEKGSIEFSLVLNNDVLTFTVRDSGVGIAEENIIKLFDPFSQVDSSIKRRQQGVGLGLSIANKILILMDGNIQCKSKLGEFTQFEFSIPYIPISNTMLENSRNGMNDDKLDIAYSILVAEDNIANQMVIKALLEKRNHKVTLVETGCGAVEILKTHDFDLILMDMMMPEMDGIEATEIIRKQNNVIPIIALTANAGLDDKKQCLAVGMDDVITKPVDSKLLYSKIAFYGQ